MSSGVAEGRTADTIRGRAKLPDVPAPQMREEKRDDAAETALLGPHPLASSHAPGGGAPDAEGGRPGSRRRGVGRERDRGPGGGDFLWSCQEFFQAAWRNCCRAMLAR